MAKDKKSFIAYVNWKTTFEALPDDKAGQLAKHLFRYVADENPQTDDILINAVFANIKEQLKQDLIKWKETSLQRADVGRIGGIKSGEARRRKANNNEANEANEAIALKTKQNEHDNDIDIDNDIEKKKNNNYIESGHLSITWDEMNKLIDEFGETKATDVVNRVLNYRKNSKYKSLYLTALNWLKKDQEEKRTIGLKPKLAI